jgi:Ice-binding-like/Bacterial Ig-like domain
MFLFKGGGLRVSVNLFFNTEEKTMKFYKMIIPAFTVLAVFLISASLIGCGNVTGGGSSGGGSSGPRVQFTDPAANATSVGTNMSITATFNVSMDAATITPESFSLVSSEGAAIAGTVTYEGLVATLKPTSNLKASTTYEATVTTAVKSFGGTAISTKTWRFMTGSSTDTTAPVVNSTIPDNNETVVDTSESVSVIFSKEMDTSSLTTASFLLSTEAGAAVTGEVTRIGSTATFNPTAYLDQGTTYEARITTAAKDLAGNHLASAYTWIFTTRSAAASGPGAVNLRTAGTFAILAKSAITTTGTTLVTGDAGVSPAAASTITGFALVADPSNVFSTSTLVNGKIYAANYAPPTPANMTTAISDMQTAYVDAAGRTNPTGTELFAGNLTGHTMTAGLYKWGTGVSINSAGAVTLSGSADDVWIFQIAGNLTIGSGAAVTLSGGAQAKNVFWQVAGKATLNTTADFKGNILCLTQINMLTGAKMTGRALAQTQVTMQSNKVIKP